MIYLTSNFILELHSGFLANYETILEIVFIFLNAYNIFANYNNNLLVLFGTLVLGLGYFWCSPRNVINKLELLFIFITFSVVTGIVESYLISYSGGTALKYGKTCSIMNIPMWLVSAYSSMVIIFLGLQRYFQNVIVPIWNPT